VISDLPVGQNLQDHHVVSLIYLNLCPFNALESELWVFTPNTQVAGFIQSNVSVHTWPDIQYTFVPLPTEGGVNLFELVIFVVDPQTLGTVTVANKDPLKTSIKSYNYPGTTRDVEAINYAVAVAENFMAAGPFAECFGPRISPAAGTNIRSFISSTSAPVYHIAGTNGIGRVVDHNLSVLGTRNLFVLDASVMPSIANCNTGIPTAVIAERGTELILANS